MRFSHLLHGMTGIVGAMVILVSLGNFDKPEQTTGFFIGVGSGTVILLGTLWSANYNAND